MAQIIFVTGASGLVGSNVVKHLLDEGYHVRAAARGDRAKHLKDNAGVFGDQLKIIEINDLSSDDLSEALSGVHAVTLTGCLNIVKQAEKAGVQRVIMTGSVGAVMNPQNTFKNTDWNPITKEEALASGDTMAVYCASKKYAEQALWEWADAHPDMDFTTISPPFVLAPILRELFPAALSNPKFTSSNRILYNFLDQDCTFPLVPFYIDARDLAKAHVRALKAPHASSIGRKRIVISAPHNLDFKEAINLLAEKRPELKPRLTKSEPPTFATGIMPCDFDRIEEVLGMKKGDFFTLEQTLLDTLDDYLDLEKEWARRNL